MAPPRVPAPSFVLARCPGGDGQSRKPVREDRVHLLGADVRTNVLEARLDRNPGIVGREQDPIEAVDVDRKRESSGSQTDGVGVEEFRQHWARHDVRFHISGVEQVRHSQVGVLALNYEHLDVAFDTGLTICAYTADPGTRSAQALNLLARLAATEDAASSASADAATGRHALRRP